MRLSGDNRTTLKSAGVEFFRRLDAQASHWAHSTPSLAAVPLSPLESLRFWVQTDERDGQRPFPVPSLNPSSATKSFSEVRKRSHWPLTSAR